MKELFLFGFITVFDSRIRMRCVEVWKRREKEHEMGIIYWNTGWNQQMLYLQLTMKQLEVEQVICMHNEKNKVNEFWTVYTYITEVVKI